MKIAIGTDHAGFHLKQILVANLKAEGYEILDFGTNSADPVDYPDFIRPAAEAAVNGQADRAIVLGGSGNGEAITANKVRGVRCALCWNEDTARLATEHNNANVISLGARQVSDTLALLIVHTWLAAKFEGGRHLRRIQKIEPPL
jgi:ribose 5-phosphate isomerase B